MDTKAWEQLLGVKAPWRVTGTELPATSTVPSSSSVAVPCQNVRTKFRHQGLAPLHLRAHPAPRVPLQNDGCLAREPSNRRL